MSGYVMNVDFFGNSIRCETEHTSVSLTDLARAGNMHRAQNGLAIKPLQAVVESVGFQEMKAIASKEMPNSKLLYTEGVGNKKRTMAHITLAVYAAEQYSTEFHYRVIKFFIEGKLLEFRELGGTEFKNLNASIDLYLPGREDKDNTGLRIQVAKQLRTKIMGAEAKVGCWDSATVGQTHARYDFEKRLCDFLHMGVVRDYEHLKEIIDRL